MPAYRTLIVDDNSSQQQLLQDQLAAHRDLHLCAVCSNADEAAVAILNHQPHLVFLDVEMPGKTGFQLLESLGEISFQVIITTGFAQYAIDACNRAALYFLLKPVQEDELTAALDRFRLRQHETDQISVRHLIENLKYEGTGRQKIGLPTADGLLYVPMADIVRCEVKGNFTIFQMVDKSDHIVSRTLKECEKTLHPPHFVRIHQSHLINCSSIKRYIKGDGGEVEMEGGLHLPVSRAHKDDLLEAMRKI